MIEIWSDLKDKRLWPVALLLALALVAVPFVLAKPAEEAPLPAAGPLTSADATAPAGQVLPAELEAAKPLLETSTLSEFASKNPFKPLRNLEQIDRAAGVETTSTDDSGATGDTGAGDDSGAKGDDTGGSTPPVQTEEKQVFTYQAVVELTTASGVKTRRVDRLEILPRDTNPLLVFLGVSSDDPSEAVFLVDSTVTQAGEGGCRPSPTTCSFLTLTADETRNEHIFTDDDGKEYAVKLIEVRRVQVKPSRPDTPSPDAQAGGSSFVSVSPGDAAAPAPSPFEGFSFPLFADEEE